MLHPRDFRVNETWLVFKLNDAPMKTIQDGDFNVLVLMDAASCYIVSSAMISVSAAEPSVMESRRMLEEGKAPAGGMPRELIVPDELCAENLIAEAERQGLNVRRLPESQLRVYTADARSSFQEQFGKKDKP